MKKIVFDMGNTLINFHQGKYTDEEKDQIGLKILGEYLLENHEINITQSQLNEYFLVKWLGDFPLRKKLIELDFMHYLKTCLELLGFTVDNLDSTECMRNYYFQYMKDAIAAPYVEEILKKLKNEGFIIHVLSNCILSEEIYVEVFKNLKLNSYIDKYTFSYNRGLRKPHIRLFEDELEGIDLNKDEIYFVGDNINVDIIPAVRVGMKGIWYNTNKNEKTNEIICHEISDFREIFNIISEKK